MTGSKQSPRRRDARKPPAEYKRPDELGQRIRPQVHVPDELRAAAQSVQEWNALLEDAHNQAIFVAWDAKLKLLLRHYSLADDDWYGLALILAVEHEAGFQVDRQIAPLPPGFWGAVEIKDGKIVDDRTRKPNRPLVWSFRRLHELMDDVQAEKQKSGCSKDSEALERLARKTEWKAPPNHSGGRAWVKILQKRLCEAKKQDRALGPTAAKLMARAKIIQRELAD
jgi:hypothetical protein